MLIIAASHMSALEIIIFLFLVIAGLGLTIWGGEAFELGWYSDRVWAPLLGLPCVALGGIGVYAMLGGTF